MVDGAGADEQLRGRLTVRRALAHRAHDLQLLRREALEAARVPPARPFAGGAQLAARPLLPWLGPEPREELQRGAELGTGLDPPPLAAQVLAVQQGGARQVE